MRVIDDTGQQLGIMPPQQALAIARHLGGTWAVLAAVGRIVPAVLRDALYNAVARTRYRVFGRYDACPLPAPEDRARFLP